MAKHKKFTLYKLISILAFIALVFILVLPQVTNVKKREKLQQRYEHMNKIHTAIKRYMRDREKSFRGDLIELVRTGYLKHSYESPFDGHGDKYIARGDYETGEITVKDPNEAQVPIPDEFKIKKE